MLQSVGSQRVRHDWATEQQPLSVAQLIPSSSQMTRRFGFLSWLRILFFLLPGCGEGSRFSFANRSDSGSFLVAHTWLRQDCC